MDEHRARVLRQLGVLVERNAVHRAFPREFGGEDNHGGNLAAFGDLVLADPSLQIKAGVQWGLFSSAILHLGTAEHHRRWLPGAMDLSVPGAFAMTEIGHGSDVASIATTATYDEATQEFVIHTPFKGAWKDYLGNAALHGRAATVFAQLITRGVNHGVHCFYVPIRDEEGAFLPGVGGEDDGLKGGLNGIDNGRLHFTQVRIPRTNLLNRYGDVAEDGTYSSPIASPGRRFFTMLGTLVQGRVSLSLAATTASFLGLHGALAYAEQRRQFKASDPQREEVLLDYQNHQRRLIDRLARAYADAFASNELVEKFDDVFSGRSDTDVDRQELETLAAAVKPLTTWHALDTLQEAREACGGAGFLAENRVAQMRADLDVYVTFEGDNTVLLQLVGKRLLTDYSKEFGRLNVGAVSRYVVHQASDALHRAGLHKAVQSVADGGSERRSANWFKDPAVQHELLTERVRAKTADIAGTLSGARGKGQAAQAEAFNTRQHELIEAARNHGELLQWEAFTRALEGITDETTKTVLTWLRDLFALRLIEDDLGWFVAHGRVSSQRARALRGYVNRLAERLRPSPSSSSSRSASSPSTCAWRWPRTPRPSARRRPTPGSRPAGPPVRSRRMRRPCAPARRRRGVAAADRGRPRTHTGPRHLAVAGARVRGRAGSAQHGLVDLDRALRDGLPREVLDRAGPAGLTHRAGALRVLHDAGERGREVGGEPLLVHGRPRAVVDLLEGDEQAGLAVLHDLRDAAHGGGDDGGAARHRLEVDDAQRLVDRGAGEHGGGREDLHHLVARDHPLDHDDALAGASQLGDQLVHFVRQLRGVRGADAQHELDVLRQPQRCTEQVGHALLARDAADERDGGLVRVDSVLLQCGGAGLRGPDLRVDAVVDRVHLRRVHVRVAGQDVPTHAVRDRDDRVRPEVGRALGPAGQGVAAAELLRLPGRSGSRECAERTWGTWCRSLPRWPAMLAYQVWEWMTSAPSRSPRIVRSVARVCTAPLAASNPGGFGYVRTRAPW